MARGKKASKNDDLLMDDDLQEDFLDDTTEEPKQEELATEEDWENEQPAGQLALDIYETPKKLIVKARVAGVNKDDLDVSITSSTLTITGTLSSGDEINTENFHIQECYWGDFARIIELPVEVKEDEVEAVLKDGVLTISFTKIKQETIKKIHIN